MSDRSSRKVGMDGPKTSLWAKLAAAVCLIWLGMILGVALAALVKFQAPSLTRPAALDVGRHVFGVFSTIGIGLVVIVTGFLVAAGDGWKGAALLSGIWTSLLLQNVWLLPVLGSRAEKVLAGQTLEESAAHAFYAGLEGVKLVLLILVSVSWGRSK